MYLNIRYREFSPYANFITANFVTVFFKTITIILLMRFYGLFILLVRSLAKVLANAIFG